MVNPNEKPPLANGWLVTTWAERGMFSSLTLASRELYLEPAWRQWLLNGSSHANWPLLLDVRVQWFVSA